MGTGDNALVMQPADYDAFNKLTVADQKALMAKSSQVLLNAQSLRNAGWSLTDQASNARLIASCPSGDCGVMQVTAQAAAGVTNAVVQTVKEGALTVLDVAGKSAAVQVDTELGTNDAGNYKPLSVVGKSVSQLGIGQTLSNAVDSMKILPSEVVDTATKGDVYNTTNALMKGALILDGAASLTKAGASVVKDTIQANVKAAADAAAIEKRTVELNIRADDAQQYDKFRDSMATELGGGWDWSKNAPNGGAVPGTTMIVELQVGDSIDRFGSRRGAYMSPSNTPFEQRSLPPGKIADPLETYKVLKPFDVIQEDIAPAFDQPGGGTQIRGLIPEFMGGAKPAPVNELIKYKYLEEPN